MATDIDDLLFYLETKAAYCGREATRQGNTIARHQADRAANQYVRWASWVEDQTRKVAEVAVDRPVVAMVLTDRGIEPLYESDDSNGG